MTHNAAETAAKYIQRVTCPVQVIRHLRHTTVDRLDYFFLHVKRGQNESDIYTTFGVYQYIEAHTFLFG